MDVKALAADEKAYILEQRYWLHAHPELGREEKNTTAHIAAELERMGIPVQTFPDITGCIGTIQGTKGSGKTLMLRADIDALPIQEADLTKTYASQNPGVMHACGHDCHTAMLLGAAKILSAHRDAFPGKVKLLFQMGEEIGTESRHYVEKGCLDDVDAIFGMHIWALLDAGTANLEDGERMACSDRFTLTLTGKPVLSEAPEQGADPLAAAASVVMGLQQLVSRQNDPENTFVLTVGMMNSEGNKGELARSVQLVGTTRTFNKAFRKTLPEKIEKVARAFGEGLGCQVDCTYFFGPAPLINEHRNLNDCGRKAVARIMGDKALVPMEKQMGAEDFSVFMEKVPGVFLFLGARNKEKGICCVHHHPGFEVDEDVLPNGTGIEVQFALEYLNG